MFTGTIGLRSDFVNIDHTTPYASVNLGASRQFRVAPGDKPLTVRFDIVNVFDQIYELRNGTGVGVFAPGGSSSKRTLNI
jgi:outer membrane receptor protein involved in Fe transport